MIFHITTRTAWQKARPTGTYRSDTLHSEGFIHCSTLQQVVDVANAYYRGQTGLVLLCIDPQKIRPRLVYEDIHGSGRTYPHIYGPLDVDAVVAVADFAPNADGRFSLPPALSTAANLRRDYPILEFDPVRTAVIEPQHLHSAIDIAEHCVLCFFQDVITTFKDDGQLRERHKLNSEIGHNAVYEMEVEGQRLTLAHPGVGAPLAATFLDELIALGARKFIACGGCGVLDGSIGMGQVVVVETAVRDEGTSYHYLPPAREVAAAPAAVAAIKNVLTRRHVDYVSGKTWTTDSVYRETATKVALRRAEGCLTVEMEAAAFFAVAQFRGVSFGQILYGGDDLSGDQWDHRDWLRQPSTREKLFWLAAEACLAL